MQIHFQGCYRTAADETLGLRCIFEVLSTPTELFGSRYYFDEIVMKTWCCETCKGGSSLYYCIFINTTPLYSFLKILRIRGAKAYILKVTLNYVSPSK